MQTCGRRNAVLARCGTRRRHGGDGEVPHQVQASEPLAYHMNTQMRVHASSWGRRWRRRRWRRRMPPSRSWRWRADDDQHRQRHALRQTADYNTKAMISCARARAHPSPRDGPATSHAPPPSQKVWDTNHFRTCSKISSFIQKAHET